MTNTQNKKFSELVQKSWFFWLSIGGVILITFLFWWITHHQFNPRWEGGRWWQLWGRVNTGDMEKIKNMTPEERKEFMQDMRENRQEWNKQEWNKQEWKKQENWEEIKNAEKN